MLSRITNALVRFLTPISSTFKSSVEHQEKQNKSANSRLKLVPKSEPNSEGNAGDSKGEANGHTESETEKDKKPSLNLVDSANTSEKETLQNTDSLLSLVTALKNCKVPLKRQLGMAAYKLATSTQKKSKKIRKGSIFDREAQ